MAIRRILAAAALVGLASFSVAATQQQSDVSLKLIAVIEQVKATAIDLTFSDDEVLAMVADWSPHRDNLTYEVRQALFDKAYCPAFDDRHDDYGDCYSALYYVQYPPHDYQSWGIPEDAIQPAINLRGMLLGAMKSHYANPDNLWEAYQAKKEGVLKTIAGYDPQRRADILAGAKSVCGALSLWSVEEVRDLRMTYLATEDAWLADTDNDALHTSYIASKVKLAEATGHRQAYLFIGRRHDEGNYDASIAKAVDICTDFLAALPA